MNERELLEEYTKKLRLGREFEDEFEDIPFTTKEEYLLKVLELIVGYQQINRENRLLKQAHFEAYKRLNDYDFTNVQIPKKINLKGLKMCNYIDKKDNLIFYESVGTGKTHLVTSLGIEGCDRGKKVKFFKVCTLSNELIEAYEKGELIR